MARVGPSASHPSRPTESSFFESLYLSLAWRKQTSQWRRLTALDRFTSTSLFSLPARRHRKVRTQAIAASDSSLSARYHDRRLSMHHKQSPRTFQAAQSHIWAKNRWRLLLTLIISTGMTRTLTDLRPSLQCPQITCAYTWTTTSAADMLFDLLFPRPSVTLVIKSHSARFGLKLRPRMHRYADASSPGISRGLNCAVHWSHHWSACQSPSPDSLRLSSPASQSSCGQRS